MEFLRVGGWAFAASVLTCDMLSGTEGDPIEVGVTSLLLLGFGFWLWFGDIGVTVEGLGSKIGFMNLGACVLASIVGSWELGWLRGMLFG